MKFVILLALLVGFASSRKLVKSIDFVDDPFAVKPLIDVEREKRGVVVEAFATTGNCWRTDGPIHWKAHCEYPGHDLIPQFEAKTFTDCRTACSKNAKCTHFTYDIATKFCYLKKSDTNLNDVPSEQGICGFIQRGAVSAAKQPNSGSKCWNSDGSNLSRWGVHCKFDGHELRSYHTNSFATCRFACKEHNHCTNFNYDYARDICQLMRAATNPTETPKDHSFCGSINKRSVQPIPQCWKTENPPLSTRVTYWSDKCDYNGNDFFTYKTSNSTDCRMSCSHIQKCTHFSFDSSRKKCYLQHSTGVYSPKRATPCSCGFVLDSNALIPKCP